MSVSEDVRSFMLADASIAGLVGTRVHKNHVPQDGDTPYVSYFRGGVEYENTTDVSAGGDPFRQFFDIESVSDDVSEADTLADYVRNRFANYRGAFGDGTVQACFVSDHDDDYIPRNVDADSGLHVATIRVEVIV